MAKKSNNIGAHFHSALFLTTGIMMGAVFTLISVGSSYSKSSESQGYDQFGYNYTARNFNGPADGVDKVLDGKVWGDPTYAQDKLVMKWSKAWHDARFGTSPWTCDAWEDNEWNGKVSGGSGEIWHYKIVWVGPELEDSSCWRSGGYPIWGQFEVIFSQGTDANAHFWETHAYPAGYGGF